MPEKKTILHVDDNDANRYAVSRSLTKAGFDVTEATTGAQALEMVDKNPDLVILDIRLPDINGFEVCRRIKTNPQTQRIPVLHLSASAASSADKAKGLDGGAEGYLIRPVDPVELVATVNALLRARDSEEALRESEERFRLMANSIPQLAWMARPDGSVFWYNDRWYDYTGTDFPHMQGSGWQSVLDPDDVRRVVLGFNRCLNSGQPWEDTFRLRSRHGELRWHLSRARPLRDAQGKISLWFGTNTDVTDQRETQEQLRQSKQEAEAARASAEDANRLKDEFLATLSHELRTPLNAIVGWAQILRSGNLPREEFAEGVEAIERNAKAQSQLIEDLLDVSRIISGKLRLDIQGIEMSSVVNEALGAVTPSATAKGIRIDRIISASGTRTWGDAGRLQQVVWNLLSNAIKFTEKGGTIQIILARVNSRLEVTVKDTGRGIDADFLPHVFERFRQADSSTKRSHGGLGLGLAIVRQLVELHGGKVFADSEGPGKGSTFVVQLPIYAAQGQLASVGSDPSDARNAPGAKWQQGPLLTDLKILIVEDDPDSRVLLQRLLTGRRAKATAVSSVDEALAEIEQRRFDVIISDIGMPERDGFDLIRHLRALPVEQGSRTPAVALTAFARQEDRTRLLLAGFHVHVPKPADPAELLAVVATLAGLTGTETSNPPQPITTPGAPI
ncbi:MAG TPA: response regulator [Humisphaera sp.]|nr:response regulator [Humisphaera sp.]